MNSNTDVIEIEEGSGNPYADLGLPDAEMMQQKAIVVDQILDFIASNQLAHQQAASMLGIPTSHLLEILRGNFREVSLATLTEWRHQLSLQRS